MYEIEYKCINDFVNKTTLSRDIIERIFRG